MFNTMVSYIWEVSNKSLPSYLIQVQAGSGSLTQIAQPVEITLKNSTSNTPQPTIKPHKMNLSLMELATLKER